MWATRRKHGADREDNIASVTQGKPYTSLTHILESPHPASSSLFSSTDQHHQRHQVREELKLLQERIFYGEDEE